MALTPTQLKRTIMRRVYVLYAKRIATHDVTLQGALFALALFVFAKMVHVASVIDNLLATQLGELPLFVMSALSQGEVLTLLAIGTMVFVGLSVPLKLRTMFTPSLQVAS